MKYILLAIAMAVSVPAWAEDKDSTLEAEALASIQKLLTQTRAGGNELQEKDLIERRKAGLEVSEESKTFTARFPQSKKLEDVQVFWNLGLLAAAVAGETNAVTLLEARAKTLLASAQVSEDLKQHVIIVRHEMQWALHRGLNTVDEASSEGRMAFMGGLFEAADVLTNKEPTLKLILLEAGSESGLNLAQKRELAERVLNHSGATESLRMEAGRILNGEAAYEIGKPIQLKFTALDGKEVDLSELRGKVVLIDFWATWCGPCVAEFPKLKATYEKWHSKGLEIVSVSLDDDQDALLKFLKKNGPIPWPQYFDGKGWGNEISFRFRVNAIPRVFVIDKNGNLASANASYDTSGMFFVEDYLKQPLSPK